MIKDKYDIFLEKMGFEPGCTNGTATKCVIDTEIKVDERLLIDLMESLGIGISSDDKKSLVIFNDDVNSMAEVILALYDICGLNSDDAMGIMLEAHNSGRAVAKTGSFEEMNSMKKALTKRKIGAAVE